MKIARDFGFAPLAAIIGLAVSACGHASKRADLVVLNAAEPETLDPALVTGQPEIRVVTGIFEGLLAFGTTLDKPRPGMAESWEVSDDKLVYTFHIRRDARWSNGEPLTARDFVYSWQRALAPETASDYSSQLYFVKNGRAFNEGKLKDFSQVGVKAADDYTLRVTLENPTPFFLELCSFSTLYPVHKATVEKYGDDWIKPGHIVSNGPYNLAAWRVNDRITLVKNPLYWDAAHVSLGSLDLLPASNSITVLNLYLHARVADDGIEKAAGFSFINFSRDVFHALQLHEETVRRRAGAQGIRAGRGQATARGQDHARGGAAGFELRAAGHAGLHVAAGARARP